MGRILCIIVHLILCYDVVNIIFCTYIDEYFISSIDLFLAVDDGWRAGDLLAVRCRC